jgi:hypothetical protein
MEPFCDIKIIDDDRGITDIPSMIGSNRLIDVINEGTGYDN